MLWGGSLSARVLCFSFRSPLFPPFSLVFLFSLRLFSFFSSFVFLLFAFAFAFAFCLCPCFCLCFCLCPCSALPCPALPPRRRLPSLLPPSPSPPLPRFSCVLYSPLVRLCIQAGGFSCSLSFDLLVVSTSRETNRGAAALPLQHWGCEAWASKKLRFPLKAGRRVSR